jgi:hypothetical protein
VLLPLSALISRLRQRSGAPSTVRRRALWVGWIVSLLNVVFLLVMLLSFGEGFVYGVPVPVRVLLLIPIVTGVLGFVFVALGVIAWLRGYWSVIGRLYYSSIALASVVFILFAGYWNMLGWRF